MPLDLRLVQVWRKAPRLPTAKAAGPGVPLSAQQLILAAQAEGFARKFGFSTIPGEAPPASLLTEGNRLYGEVNKLAMEQACK